MRAIWYERCGSPHEVLRLGDLPMPAARPGEVLVEMHCSGVNPHDVKKRAGWLNRALPAIRTIPHSDGAGIIKAVGPGVADSRIGERVWIFHANEAQPGAGAAADYVTVSSQHACRLPDHVSFDVGACLGVPFMTAHDAMLRDGPVTGQTVLVQGGAGAVAAYAIQLARWNGARVIATVSSDAKATHARALGADEIINYRQEDVVARVGHLTDGLGVDRIIEVDFGANLAVDHAVIKPNGVIAAYSSTREREPTLPYYAFAMKGVTLHFVQGMLLRHARAMPGIRDVTVLLEHNLLQHPIARTFAFDQTADAHAALESAEHTGKILVRNRT